MLASIPLLISVVLFCSPAKAADIYASAGGENATYFTTQPLTENYVLISRGQAEVKANSLGHHGLPGTSDQPLSALIDRLCLKHGMESSLVHAIIDIESGFNPRAVSPKGALGVMQLMPATAARFGVTDRADPAQNIEAGIRYLKRLLEMHQDNLALALAAYNAGEGAVARRGRRIPAYRETMLYVPAVLARLQARRALLNQ